jgi:ubiquinone/menaquinone biosynthesis C-methylase UbiE
MLGWKAFEQAATTYEQWYATPRGRRAALAERLLLKWLLSTFRENRSILEIGCGTGHFTGWLAESGFHVVGLDRSPAMIEQARERLPHVSFLQADAFELPFPRAAFDVVVFVTALEFVDHPSVVLREAVRVARQGVVVIALNRHSFGALARRWSRSRQPLLSQARDYSIRDLRRVLRDAASDRLRPVAWSATLFPGKFWSLRARLPLGNVIGVSLQLQPELAAAPSATRRTWVAGQVTRTGELEHAGRLAS